MEQIIIDIDKDGDVRIDAVGFSGPECTQLTAALEEALGEVTARQLKPEYRQPKAILRKAGA
mgnify:CR=1 FL=1